MGAKEIIAPLIQQLILHVHFHTKTCNMCSSGTRTCISGAFSYKIVVRLTLGVATLENEWASFDHKPPPFFSMYKKVPP
jgi:hypothetical protein